jgi:hypothetical protein
MRVLGWKPSMFATAMNAPWLPPPCDADVLGNTAPPPSMRPELVREAHTKVRRALGLLMTKGGCFEKLQGIRGVTRSSDGIIRFAGGDSELSDFLAAVWRLLVAAGPRFRVCKRTACSGYFIARHARSNSVERSVRPATE